MLTAIEKQFLEKAVALSKEGMQGGQGGPFGCVIVKDGQVVGEGCNRVTSTNDPTAHAEVVAIRDACRRLDTYQLTGCDVYASCEPCPMCLGAIYWARPDRVIYANTKGEAAAAGFDDDFIYREINTGMEDRRIAFIHAPSDSARQVFEAWRQWEGKKEY
ncbi:MAG: nucleoside deaminase [Chitinophagaceae bacterium]